MWESCSRVWVMMGNGKAAQTKQSYTPPYISLNPSLAKLDVILPLHPCICAIILCSNAVYCLRWLLTAAGVTCW